MLEMNNKSIHYAIHQVCIQGDLGRVENRQ